MKMSCPFCGEYSADDWFETRATTNVAVACPECGSIGPDKVDKETAMAAWNTRFCEHKTVVEQPIKEEVINEKIVDAKDEVPAAGGDKKDQGEAKA